jgi:probable rRNA maturation factor
MGATLTVEIKQSDIVLDEQVYRRILDQAIAYVENKKSLHPEQRDVSLVITGDEEVKQLNTLYRKKPKTTDVLSFGFYTDKNDTHHHTGDIIMSYPQIVRQASEFGHTPTQELMFLFVHGVLHLFGYTDDTTATREQMIEMGNDILKRAHVD